MFKATRWKPIVARWMVLLTVAACMGMVLPVWAESPGKSLDEQLMDDRDAHPLDADADRDLSALEPKTPTPQAEAKPSEGDVKLEQRLKQELGEAAISEDSNPLADIARQMRAVKDLLQKPKSAAQTKSRQEDILVRLDKLLDEARQKSSSNCNSSGKCNSQQSSQEKPSGQPQASNQAKPGTGGKANPNPKGSSPKATGAATRRPTADELRALVKSVWGELPEHLREQVQPTSIEEFLPKYEAMIEAYFKRLSEEEGKGSDR